MISYRGVINRVWIKNGIVNVKIACKATDATGITGNNIAFFKLTVTADQKSGCSGMCVAMRKPTMYKKSLNMRFYRYESKSNSIVKLLSMFESLLGTAVVVELEPLQGELVLEFSDNERHADDKMVPQDEVKLIATLVWAIWWIFTHEKGSRWRNALRTTI
jgi:hypothetical protein